MTACLIFVTTRLAAKVWETGHILLHVAWPQAFRMGTVTLWVMSLTCSWET